MRLRLFVLVSATLLASACAGGPARSGTPCATSDECGGGMQCVQDAPLTVCPAGSGCGASNCVSRCRPLCESTSDCPTRMACARRFAILEQTNDCDAVVGDYVQVCTPPDSTSDRGEEDETSLAPRPRALVRPVSFCDATDPF